METASGGNIAYVRQISRKKFKINIAVKWEWIKSLKRKKVSG